MTAALHSGSNWLLHVSVTRGWGTCSRLTVLVMTSGEPTARQRSSSALSSLRSACARRSSCLKTTHERQCHVRRMFPNATQAADK